MKYGMGYKTKGPKFWVVIPDVQNMDIYYIFTGKDKGDG